MKSWQIIAIAIGAAGALLLLSRRALAKSDGRGTPLPPLDYGNAKSYETKMKRLGEQIVKVKQGPRGSAFSAYYVPVNNVVDAAYLKAAADNSVDFGTVLKGASVGGTAGTIIPGVGNVIGGAVGAIGGFFKGLYDEHERADTLKDQHVAAIMAAYQGVSDLMVREGV